MLPMSLDEDVVFVAAPRPLLYGWVEQIMPPLAALLPNAAREELRHAGPFNPLLVRVLTDDAVEELVVLFVPRFSLPHSPSLGWRHDGVNLAEVALPACHHHHHTTTTTTTTC